MANINRGREGSDTLTDTDHSNVWPAFRYKCRYGALGRRPPRLRRKHKGISGTTRWQQHKHKHKHTSIPARATPPGAEEQRRAAGERKL